MNGVKRLTPPQSRKVNALVRRTCCNYDNGNCILLDDGDECVCPQLISYSLLCKWFRVAVLPADRLLYAELYQTGDKKKCTECGAFFECRILQKQLLDLSTLDDDVRAKCYGDNQAGMDGDPHVLYVGEVLAAYEVS